MVIRSAGRLRRSFAKRRTDTGSRADHGGMTLAARLAAHAGIATALDLLSDRELAGRVAAGTPLGTGIGGRAMRIAVEGREVFVKRVPLTDLERRPDPVRSTANLFGLPPQLHYGIGAVGSPGFGAWR